MKIRSLVLLLLALAPAVVQGGGPDASQAETQNAPKAPNPLAFQETDNKNLMRLLAKFITKAEAEEEREKFADALHAARKANLLRLAEHTVENFTARAEGLATQLLDFLAMLDMARSVIEESFDRSSIVNYSESDKKKALLIRLIGLEQEEQKRLLKDAVAQVHDFRALLDQLSAVNEVLLANLPAPAKKAIAPYMKKRIDAENVNAAEVVTKGAHVPVAGNQSEEEVGA